MKHLIVYAALTLTAALPSSVLRAADHEFPGPPVLNQQVLVEGPVVRLGDIFTGLEGRAELASTPIAKAPSVGRRIELDARWLGALARAYGLDWQPRTHLDSTTLERASQTLPASEIRAALLSALEARGASGNITLAMDVAELRITLPAEAEPTFAIRNLVYDGGSGRFFGQIVAPAEGPAEARIKVSGSATLMVEIPVLRHRISPGEVISSSDIDWRSTRADRMAQNSLTELSDIVGLSPRRSIAPGQAIRAGDLEIPVTVAKKSLVTVHLVTANMTLTVQGRAMENGSMGEAIRVMNTKSNSVITAVVRGPGEVEVVTASLAAAN